MQFPVAGGHGPSRPSPSFPRWSVPHPKFVNIFILIIIMLVRLIALFSSTLHSVALLYVLQQTSLEYGIVVFNVPLKGGGALCAGNAVALLVFGPVMP